MSEKNDSLDEMMGKVRSGLQKAKKKIFVPTGVLEPAVIEAGTILPSSTKIIAVICANKLGKTATAVNIAKSIFWGSESEYFDYPAYHEWPINADGEVIKNARFAGTKQNLMTSGPIREEYKKWWPEGRYEEFKSGSTYFSNIQTDTKWSVDLLTYEQDPDAFEGPVKSFQWLDEPPPANVLGGVTSRFYKGGLLLFTMTPVSAGVFLDYLDDLKEKGSNLVRVQGSIWDNSSEKGPLNSKGTKRGLMTEQEIENYVKTIPLDEREVRLHGQTSHKSGKIYADFDLTSQVIDFDLTDKYVQLSDDLYSDISTWNCYMVIDPHPKYYHSIQWWAIDENDNHICYNEWPKYRDLGAHYDEVRTSKESGHTIGDVARFIKVRDGLQYGLKIKARFVDPWYVSSETKGASKKVSPIVEEFANYGLVLKTPPYERIAVQRDEIRNRCKWNKDLPINIHNRPKIFYNSDCTNSIRAISRHHWKEGKEIEAEGFKDFCDTIRIFEAGVKMVPYESEVKQKKKVEAGSWDAVDHYSKDIVFVPMG